MSHFCHAIQRCSAWMSFPRSTGFSDLGRFRIFGDQLVLSLIIDDEGLVEARELYSVG